MSERVAPTDLISLPEIEQRLRAVPLRGFASTTLPPVAGTTIPSTSWEVDYLTLAHEVARMLEARREADALSICLQCREALSGEGPEVEERNGNWVHVHGEYAWRNCAAAAIRSQR